MVSFATAPAEHRPPQPARTHDPKPGLPQFPVDAWLDRVACDPTGRAYEIARFIQRHRLWEGARANQPFELLPFQHAAINRIYGPSKRDGSRLVRTAAIWIPRGNGKTPLASALALAHLYGPCAEPGGQVVLAAADKGDATTAFRHCHYLAEQEGWERDVLRSRYGRKEMDHMPSNSVLKAISMEPYSKHSFNVSYFLCDEIHAWPQVYARDLFNIITDSMAKRANPLTVIISVAPQGTGGLAVDLWDYSLKVARGEIDDPTFAPIIFAAPEDCDWRDEQVWHAVNPALSHGLISINELRNKARKAEHFPADVAGFKRYHLNIPQEGVGEPWVDLSAYDAQPPIAGQLVGRKCFVGIDLSSVEDLTAVVAVFPDAHAGYDVLAHFFLPEANIAKKAEQDRAGYERWAAAGYLTLTPGNVVDYDAMHRHVETLGADYDVRAVLIDRWNSTATNTRLQEAGFDVVQFGQGWQSMAAPVKELKRAILAGEFRHGGNPVLRMCVGNATTEKDAAGNEKLTKAKSRGRIDGAVAAAMAVGGALSFEEAPEPEPGFMVFDAEGSYLGGWP